MIGRALLWLAIGAPWLALVPGLPPVLATLLGAAFLTAAAHGYGRLLRRDADAWLAIQWGIAALIALGGLATAAHVAGRITFLAVLAIGAAAHSFVLFRRRAALRARPELRFAALPWLLLAGVGILAILGAAGEVGARMFDDDGHHLAQLRRLFDTGTLGDGLGYARSSQLGGQLVIEGFGAAIGSIDSRWVDNGLGLLLAIGLGVSRIRPRDATTTAWACLLVLVLAALPFVLADPSTCWIAAGLVVALAVTLEEAAREGLRTVPLALLAGALATLRSELIPVAAVFTVGAWWVERERGEKTVSVLAGVIAAVVVPLLVSRMLARSDAHASLAMVTQVKSLTLAHAASFAGVFVLGCALLVLDDDERRLRWPLLASVAGLAGIISQLSAPRPYATRFVWPIVLALATLLLVELARRPRVQAAALVLSLAGLVYMNDGAEAAGRLRWFRRVSTSVANVEYLARGANARRPGAPYDALLARVPEGATVAVWVARPELLDYSAHRIIDLRTPRTAALRRSRWPGGRSQLEELVKRVNATYLLIEADHELVRRTQLDPVQRTYCAIPREECADTLEVLAWHFRRVATDDGTMLLDLSHPL